MSRTTPSGEPEHKSRKTCIHLPSGTNLAAGSQHLHMMDRFSGLQEKDSAQEWQDCVVEVEISALSFYLDLQNRPINLNPPYGFDNCEI